MSCGSMHLLSSSSRFYNQSTTLPSKLNNIDHYGSVPQVFPPKTSSQAYHSLWNSTCLWRLLVAKEHTSCLQSWKISDWTDSGNYPFEFGTINLAQPNKEFSNWHQAAAPELQLGDSVWLSSNNLTNSSSCAVSSANTRFFKRWMKLCKNYY